MNTLKIFFMVISVTILYNCKGSTQSSKIAICTNEAACNYMDENSCLYEESTILKIPSL